MDRVTRRVSARRVVLPIGGEPGHEDTRADVVAVEEPLEIRVDGAAVNVTMRTPGDDFDLTLGWLATEGALHHPSGVRTLRHCQDLAADGAPTFNVVEVASGEGFDAAAIGGRTTFASSACGVCGTASIDAVRTAGHHDLREDPFTVDAATLAAMPATMREHQRGFARTGGTHAAGLFAADGTLLCLREDVGRHNAVDKVIGWAVRENRLPLRDTVLVVSSRAGFEIAQKAVVAGIPVLAAVSAATSLAIELARDSGLTLAAFVRPPHLTVYADEGRIRVDGRG